jgi:hypothetical protein
MREPHNNSTSIIERRQSRFLGTGLRSLGSTNARRSMPYLAVKTKGDKRMALKWRSPEGVYGDALQDLSDMVKAGLPEPQPPVVKLSTSRSQRIYCGATENSGQKTRGQERLPLDGHWVVNPIKVANEAPKSLYIRPLSANAGWPKGRESYGHGDPIVVRGRENRLHRRVIVYGEAGQVLAIPSRGGTRDA